MDALLDFAETLRDRAALARRNAEQYGASGYRGEALLLEERARAFEAAAQLAEDEAERADRNSGSWPQPLPCPICASKAAAEGFVGYICCGAHQ
jgi:hypothetical protein